MGFNAEINTHQILSAKVPDLLFQTNTHREVQKNTPFSDAHRDEK